MKAALVTASVSRNAGGLLPVLIAHAQRLQKDHGCNVEVLGLHDAHTDADHAQWQPLIPKTFPVTGPRAFGYAPALVSALRDGSFDLVHTQGIWMYPSVAANAWHRRTGKPYIISPHGMLDPWALANARWKKQLAAVLYERKHLRHAACLHALCPSEAQSIRGYGLTNPIAVIPNGTELPATDFRNAPPADVPGLPANRRVLLFLGRLHPKKGLPALLRAWSVLARNKTPDFDNWSLAIAGWDQGGHRAELETIVKEEGLGNAVHLLGSRFGAEKEALLRRADAFVLPSQSEGLPMAVLEAWAYRLPVLMTEACNLPEGFTAGAAARIDLEPAAMAAALGAFLSQPDDARKAMGAKGRALVEERFTWEKACESLYAVYRWILGGGAPPPCVEAR